MLHIVTGPPCAGKSTHVTTHAQLGDVVVDYDVLASALGCPTSHGATGAVRDVTVACRTAAIEYLLANSDIEAWVIDCTPNPERAAAYEAAGAETTLLDPGIDECLARAARDARSDETCDLIRAWYEPKTKGMEMKITRKDAPITTAPTDDGPGTWTAILSAPTLDRDGDTLTPDGWKQPLPPKIPIDIDHEMSVRGTIGSAVPSIDDDGNLVVSGTFASTPLAQEVRTLMAEGHIDRMSVAYMTTTTTKGNASVQERELLNGAIVCIPSNREAAVLEVRNAKITGDLDHAPAVVKEGRRNNSSDAQTIQQIHDAAATLGADCAGAKSWQARDQKAAQVRPDRVPSMPGRRVKSLVGSVEALQDRAIDALGDALEGQSYYLIGIKPDEGVIVYAVASSWDGTTQAFEQPYTDDGTTFTLTGDATPVDVMQITVPDSADSPASPASPVLAAPLTRSHDAATDATTSPDIPGPAAKAAPRMSAEELAVATHPAVIAARAVLLQED